MLKRILVPFSELFIMLALTFLALFIVSASLAGKQDAKSDTTIHFLELTWKDSLGLVAIAASDSQNLKSESRWFVYWADFGPHRCFMEARSGPYPARLGYDEGYFFTSINDDPELWRRLVGRPDGSFTASLHSTPSDSLVMEFRPRRNRLEDASTNSLLFSYTPDDVARNLYFQMSVYAYPERPHIRQDVDTRPNEIAMRSWSTSDPAIETHRILLSGGTEAVYSSESGQVPATVYDDPADCGLESSFRLFASLSPDSITISPDVASVLR